MSKETKVPQLNFGTSPTTEKLETIEVNIDPDIMLKDWAKAYANEITRRNPIRAASVNLTENELQTYFLGVLAIRVTSVTSAIPRMREVRSMYIPSFLEYIITTVGEVVDVDTGLKFIPSFKHSYDLDELLALSDKLRFFVQDGLGLHQDAFPRKPDGDKEVMSMALIQGYVKSMTKTAHPVSSYATAFLGLTLEKEQMFSLLYRVRYDDVDFIRSMLLREGSLF